MRWKYLHFLIQHEITVIAPNMNAASAHQAMDYRWRWWFTMGTYTHDTPYAKPTERKKSGNKIPENMICYDTMRYIYTLVTLFDTQIYMWWTMDRISKAHSLWVSFRSSHTPYERPNKRCMHMRLWVSIVKWFPEKNGLPAFSLAKNI